MYMDHVGGNSFPKQHQNVPPALNLLFWCKITGVTEKGDAYSRSYECECHKRDLKWPRVLLLLPYHAHKTEKD